MANGNRPLAIAGRDIAGPVVSGPPRRAASRWLGVPALVLVGGVLGVPIVWTLALAVSTDGGDIGPDNFVVLFDEPDATHALLNTLGWVLIAVVAAVVALVIAVLSRPVRRPAAVLLVALIAPLGVSALVAGAGFRLIFDSSPHRSTATAIVVALQEVFLGSAPPNGPAWLTPGLIWVALVSAFAWAWVGFAVSLFRRGLDAVPDDLLRMARAEGVGWVRRQLTIVLPLLRPALAVVVLTLVVAALRLFDLVLIMAPSWVQDDVNVVAVQWWRSSDDGQAAALATLLFAAVGVVALAALAGLRGWGEHRAVPRPGTRTRGWAGTRRRFGIALAAALAALWLFPMLVLLATALHSPRDAAVAGWWLPGENGISLKSFGDAFEAGLWAAVGSTAVLATTATALVLICAVPAAYLLAWGDLPGWARRAAIITLTMFAVAPVPMYAGPLAKLLADIGFAGSRAPLIVVHAAAGVPIAVLLLRTAFAAVPASLLATSRLGGGGQWRALDLVRRHGADSLIAVAVLEFVLVWNDFTLGLLVSGPTSSPLTIVLWGQARQFGTSAGPVAAGAVISAVVPVAVVLLTWRRVVDGLTGSSRRAEQEGP